MNKKFTVFNKNYNKKKYYKQLKRAKITICFSISLNRIVFLFVKIKSLGHHNNLI